MLLQIVHRVCESKNFANRSIIGEDMDESKAPRFGPTLYIGKISELSKTQELKFKNFQGPTTFSTNFEDLNFEKKNQDF